MTFKLFDLFDVKLLDGDGKEVEYCPEFHIRNPSDEGVARYFTCDWVGADFVYKAMNGELGGCELAQSLKDFKENVPLDGVFCGSERWSGTPPTHGSQDNRNSGRICKGYA